MAPSARTIRYEITGEVPADPSTIFFRVTQVPHVKCFVSSRYVVVGLASPTFLEEHCSQDNTRKLKAEGFNLIESQEARSSRTLLAFRPQSLITQANMADLKSEIELKNEVAVEEIALNQRKTPFLKIRLSSPAEAEKLAKGIRAYSLIIPSYRIERERYRPVRQCLRCYQFTHATAACPSKTRVCSKCAAKDHVHTACSAEQIKCLNCGGEHVAISFDCPEKRRAQEEQSRAKNQPRDTQQPITAAAPPAPLPGDRSYATAAKPNASHATSLPSLSAETPLLPEPAVLTAKIQACSSTAAVGAGDDFAAYAKIFPLLLEKNGLPTISIPPEVTQLVAELRSPSNAAPPAAPKATTSEHTSNHPSAPSDPPSPTVCWRTAGSGCQ